MSFPCFIVFMYNLFTAYYYSFLFYTGGGQLYIQKLHLIIQFYLSQWSKPLKIDGKDEFKRDMNIIWSKMRILTCIVTYSSLFILLNYISFRSTQSLWEKYVWSEDRLLTLGRNQDVFWENNLFEGIGKFSFPLEPLPSIIAQLKTHLIQLRKQNLNKTKANKQTNKMQTKKWGWRKSNPDLCHKKKKEKRKNRQTNNCWFSHDVTKKFKPQLSILRRFYFHGVLEQVKTNFQTNCRFRGTLGFVIEYAWISKLLRDTAFTWRPRELSCRLKKLLC